MEAGSARALDVVIQRLDALLDTAGDAGQLGTELFAVADLLDRESTLRRSFTEPTVDQDARRGILRALLSGRVSEPALELMDEAVSQRWSRSRDLVDAVEQCAVLALATRAEQTGELDALEDALFRFGRILCADTPLREALSDQSAPMPVRLALLDRLVAGKVGPITRQLLEQALAARRRSVVPGLECFQQLAAARRRQLIATVWVAAPLRDDQRDRLASALRGQYGKDVHLNVVVDPDVLGGVRIAIGDDIIDSTMASRLVEAQRRVVR